MKRDTYDELHWRSNEISRLEVEVTRLREESRVARVSASRWIYEELYSRSQENAHLEAEVTRLHEELRASKVWASRWRRAARLWRVRRPTRWDGS